MKRELLLEIFKSYREMLHSSIDKFNVDGSLGFSTEDIMTAIEAIIPALADSSLFKKMDRETEAGEFLLLRWEDDVSPMGAPIAKFLSRSAALNVAEALNKKVVDEVVVKGMLFDPAKIYPYFDVAEVSWAAEYAQMAAGVMEDVENIMLTPDGIITVNEEVVSKVISKKPPTRPSAKKPSKKAKPTSRPSKRK